MREVSIKVYIDTGNVYEYSVESESKAREHMDAIVKTGYRSVTSGTETVLTWWPPHKIVKVVALLTEKSSTKYTDKVVST